MYTLATQSAGGSWALLILVYAVIFGGFYFIPQATSRPTVGRYLRLSDTTTGG